MGTPDMQVTVKHNAIRLANPIYSHGLHVDFIATCGSKGGGGGWHVPTHPTPPPNGPKISQFHAVFWIIW